MEVTNAVLGHTCGGWCNGWSVIFGHTRGAVPSLPPLFSHSCGGDCSDRPTYIFRQPAVYALPGGHRITGLTGSNGPHSLLATGVPALSHRIPSPVKEGRMRHMELFRRLSCADLPLRPELSVHVKIFGTVPWRGAKPLTAGKGCINTLPLALLDERTLGLRDVG